VGERWVAGKVLQFAEERRTLRKPKAMVTASNEASSKGSASADASANSSEMLLLTAGRAVGAREVRRAGERT
jgi:hypothetical protein